MNVITTRCITELLIGSLQFSQQKESYIRVLKNGFSPSISVLWKRSIEAILLTAIIDFFQQLYCIEFPKDFTVGCR
ncbi:hypothetical protein [Leptospira noguchii]|uniref:hypothetical protein n=1 Tax=Leptospira noguchii TaxID=28182 RepID=UPI000B2097F8|nr:hypothetical protein [Leptospira noguchii]UOG61303.1 TfoX/Sxy family protein [Leptospira noguchii]